MGTRRRRVSVIYFISKLVKWDDLRMEIISNPTQVEIKKAAQALMDGHLVAFPTETVYGLGADATNEKAVSRVYSVKARPTDHPLIVHISSINQLGKWAVDIPEYAMKLANEFWPGPLTLILKRSEIAKDFITGDQERIGIRVPSHPIALSLLSEFEKLGGQGVVAPSANRFGAVSPTTLAAVSEELEYYLAKSDILLEGGQCLIGIESTILDCSNEIITELRPGAVTSKLIESRTGLQVNLEQKAKIKTSGLLKVHYSPSAEVQIGLPAIAGDGFLALANLQSPPGTIRLASPENIEQFAKDLYAALRYGDEIGLKKIVVIPPEGSGLSAAINDRLIKSAGKKAT
jgi:L-threonylcarbamoyladenylate synthase